MNAANCKNCGDSLVPARDEDPRDWILDHTNIADLYEWLLERDEAPEGEDLVYMLRKPWKWHNEYVAMVVEKAAEK